ncbi:MAG: YtxH domain-containing protein [Anaerolineales bacterium]|nr:YtxH domain-containing protein [Anaerolineales bacterium]MCX7608247.1 YtxH domain-containing protein [Anaerolineales bacterium]MDW8226690.1 YtxH domain-containing protein [Anaerolineales bacterium]
MSDRDEFGAFLIGFVVGGLTGAIVALLFAPQSGEETRTYIKEKSIELRDKAAEQAEQVASQAERLAEDVRARSREAIEQVKRAVSKKAPPAEPAA